MEKKYNLRIDFALYSKFVNIKKSSAEPLARFMRKQLEYFIANEDELSKMYGEEEKNKTVSTSQNTEFSQKDTTVFAD